MKSSPRFLQSYCIGATPNPSSIGAAEGLCWPAWPACWTESSGFRFSPRCVALLPSTFGQIEHGQLQITGELLLESLLAFAVLIATGVMARFIDRRPWGYFGMPLRNAFRSGSWIGAAIGLGLLALQLEIMHLSRWFDYGKVQTHGGEIVRYGLAWALMLKIGYILGAGVLSRAIRGNTHPRCGFQSTL